MRGSSKRYLAVVILGITFYAGLVRRSLYSARFSTTIEGYPTIDVGDFVADFSNVKKLNPSVYDFDIIEESGNTEDWKYKVVYYETMGFIPLLTNVGYGTYMVKPSTADGYQILSEHRTCFFWDSVCLNTASEMIFDKADGSSMGTKFTEHVTYECPWLLSKMCSLELNHQRLAYIENLRQHFA